MKVRFFNMQTASWPGLWMSHASYHTMFQTHQNSLVLRTFLALFFLGLYTLFLLARTLRPFLPLLLFGQSPKLSFTTQSSISLGHLSQGPKSALRTALKFSDRHYYLPSPFTLESNGRFHHLFALYPFLRLQVCKGRDPSVLVLIVSLVFSMMPTIYQILNICWLDVDCTNIKIVLFINVETYNSCQFINRLGGKVHL